MNDQVYSNLDLLGFMDKNNFPYAQSSDKLACNVTIAQKSLCKNSKINCNISLMSLRELNPLLVDLFDRRHYKVELIFIPILVIVAVVL